MPGEGDQAGSASPEANQPPAFRGLGLRTPTGRTPLPAEQPLPPPTIPDYTVLRRIGGGAYGEVWLARNFTGSHFAVKVVHRCFFDHDRPFERELAGIRRFEPISRSHPSQVAIHHVGQNVAEGYFYYVMDLADDAGAAPGSELPSLSPLASGATLLTARPSSLASDQYVPKTLKHLLRTRGRLPLAECRDIGLALATALEHLHGQGLVHRDVKPSNVIFVGGVPKLADIGLVTSIDATRSFVGTEGFFPPEGPGTPAADIFSLGKLLYEIATGKDRREFPELPSDVASPAEQEALSELNAVILKACQPDPARRYATATALRGDLERLQKGRSVKRQRAWQRRWGRVRRVALPAMLGTVALVAVMVAIKQRSGSDLARLNGTDPSIGSAAAQANGKARMEPAGTAVASPGAFVLAFRNAGTNGVPDDLCSRITDAFIDALALVKDVPRCPRRSGWACWDEKELRQALAKTNVFGRILTGRLVGAGEQISLTLRLYRGAEEPPMWSESFQGTTNRIVALEREALSRLVEKLGLSVSRDEWTAIQRMLQNNLEALGWERKGYEIYGQAGTRQSPMNAAMSCAQKALRLDPLYVDAMCLDQYMLRNVAMKRNPWEVWPDIKRRSELMLSLDDSHVGALLQLCSAQMVYDHDWAACSRTHAWLKRNCSAVKGAVLAAQLARAFGQFDKARAEEQVFEASGLTESWEFILAVYARWVDRQYDQALALLREGRQRYPENADLALYYVNCLIAKGEYSEAIATIENTPSIRVEVEMVAALACAHARLGQTAKAREILKGLLDQTDARAYIEPYFIARVYVALGDKTAALDQLEKAAENRSEYLYYADWGGLRTDYYWDALTNETRYWKLCDQLGFGRDQWPRKERIE